MSSSRPNPTVCWERFGAALFDLDGVLTDTAGLHARCWKRMFDEFLKKWSVDAAESFRPFDIDEDYRGYVDGKPRFDGVRDFLRSREIELPEGSADSEPGSPTVRGLGNRKNEIVSREIESQGVDAYPSSVALVRRLREAGIKTAVVSSSANCQSVLRAARIDDLFEATVDGLAAARMGLAGKPAPDTFLAAARALGVAPERAVVVEDAVSGVQAGRNGGFGMVIGVARKGNAEQLRANGAHLVVSDLGELLG